MPIIQIRWRLEACALAGLWLLMTSPSQAQLDQQFNQQNSTRREAANQRLAMQQRCIDIIKTANYANPKDAPYGSLQGWMRVDPNNAVHWVSAANVSNGLSSAFECGEIARLGAETKLNGWLHRRCPLMLTTCPSVKTLIKRDHTVIVVYQEASPGKVKATALVPVVMRMDSTGRLDIEYK